MFLLIMGVAGCGKSTIGEEIARRTGSVYIEGDELHPRSNIEKMSSGIPLEDADRWPWFDRIIEAAKKRMEQTSLVPVGCSALKKSYRDYLFRDFPEWKIIFLRGEFDTIHSRMKEREHFMPPALLESQFATLEEPDYPPETCLTLSIEEPVDRLVETAMEWLEG